MMQTSLMAVWWSRCMFSKKIKNFESSLHFSCFHSYHVIIRFSLHTEYDFFVLVHLFQSIQKLKFLIIPSNQNLRIFTNSSQHFFFNNIMFLA